MTHEIRTPADLQQLMRSGFPPSEEQFAAITAPLEPAVVVAGAGSGKTTVMAARVVYLVATGQVRPDQVLGLTFTTKAAGELATRVRGALRDAGLLRPVGPATLDADARDDVEEPLEPTVATYNSYASALLDEHGLRIGHEPDTRVIADASRYQLAARAVARYTGDVQLLSDHPETVINYVLALEGAMSEHLVDPETLRTFQRRERAAFAAELETTKARKKLGDVISAIDRREELLGLVEAYRRLKRDLGLMDFSDQIALGARLLFDRLQHLGGAGAQAEPLGVLIADAAIVAIAILAGIHRRFGGDAVDQGQHIVGLGVDAGQNAVGHGWGVAELGHMGKAHAQLTVGLVPEVLGQLGLFPVAQPEGEGAVVVLEDVVQGGEAAVVVEAALHVRPAEPRVGVGLQGALRDGGPVALVLGSEAHGLADDVTAADIQKHPTIATVEELLDISGMNRLDALRILYTLYDQRVIALSER